MLTNPRELKMGPGASVHMLVDHPTYGTIPFLACADDVETVGRELYARAMAGEFGVIAPYIPNRSTLKRQREAAVAAITVTTAAGHTFDGDETSQWRMARAIIALQSTGTPSINWVLADNSVIQASAAELTEALALAGAAQAALWVIA